MYEKTSYRISEKAVEDLEKIWIHTFEKWSLEQADRYYNLIISEIEFIAEHPLAGRPINYIKDGYRLSVIKSHLIFCKQGTDGIIEVIRIMHQKMDVDSRLND